MKNLILVRHAKSSWEAPLQDVDRPLLHRGIVDAHLVSSAISNYIPNTFLLWSSIAKRASETIKRQGFLGRSGSLPGKLSDCNSEDSMSTELYIVE